MTYAVVIGVFLLSLTIIPVVYGIIKLDDAKSSNAAMGSFLVCIVSVFGLSYLLFRRYFKRVDPAMYVFSFMCWTGVGSLMLGLEVDGRISKFIGITVLEGEPYLKSAHGAMISYWDGTVQTLLCLTAIALYCYRQSHREVALFWAGSLLNQMVVLIPAAVTGPHKVKPEIFANMLYIAAPLCIAIWYLHRSPIQARSFIHFPPIWRRPVDLLFVIFFDLAALFAAFRLLTVLGGNSSCMKDYLKSYDPYLKDASMFPKMQTLTYGYFFFAYYIVAIYGLIFPGQHWMADWSFIHAGAAAQAQFSYVAGALHHLTSKGLHPPTTGQAAALYWTANILLFVVPQLFAFWLKRDFESHGRTYTVDLAQPVTTYVVKNIKCTTTITARKSSGYSSEYSSEYSQSKTD